MITNKTGAIEMTAARSLRRKNNCTLKEAARDFEAVFIGQLFKNMHSTVGNEGVIKQSFPRKIYEEMIQREYAKVYAKRGGMGLGRVLAEQLESSTKGRAQRNGKYEITPGFKEVDPKEVYRGVIQNRVRIKNLKKAEKFYKVKNVDDSARGLSLKEREAVDASKKIR